MKQTAKDGRVYEISETCDHVLEWRIGETEPVCCGLPSEYWYPAMGGGTAALCETHGAKYFPLSADRIIRSASVSPSEGTANAE